MLLAVPGGGRSSAAPVATSLPATASPWGRVAVPQRQPGQHQGRAGFSHFVGKRVDAAGERGRSNLSGTAAAGVPGVGALTAGPVGQAGGRCLPLPNEGANVYAVTWATGKLM